MMNWIFVVALALALIALAAMIARHYAIAIIAALVGAAIIVLGCHGDSQQLPTGGETVQPRHDDSPVQWSRLYINGAASQPGTVVNISALGIMGTNVSNEEIKLDEVYFLCGLDGTKLNAQIGRGGARYKTRDLGPLPPGALFFVVSDPLGSAEAPFSPSEFLKAWATITFVARYNGTTQRIEFDRQTVESALPKP